jgi:hypothetical protein
MEKRKLRGRKPVLAEAFSDSQRIHDLEILTKLQQSQMVMLSETLRELSVSTASGFTTAFLGLKKAQKHVRLLNQKIQALASTLIKETDAEPDEIEKELEQIKMASVDLDEEIKKLIEITNPYVDD